MLVSIESSIHLCCAKDCYKAMTSSGIMYSISVVCELCAVSGQPRLNIEMWQNMVQAEYSRRLARPGEFKVSIVSEVLLPGGDSIQRHMSSSSASASEGISNAENQSSLKRLRSDSFSDSLFDPTQDENISSNVPAPVHAPMPQFRRAAKVSRLQELDSLDVFRQDSEVLETEVEIRENQIHNNHRVRKMCQDNIHLCSQHTLVEMVQKANAQRDDYKGKLQEARKRVAALQRQNTQLIKRLEKEQTKVASSDLEITRINVHMTTRGRIALGIRKALAITSSVGFPLCALVDCSRWTVVRAEISVWAGLVSRSKAFHNLFTEKLHTLTVWRKPLRDLQHQADSTSLVVYDPTARQAKKSDGSLDMVLSEMDAISHDLGVPCGLDTTAMCVQDMGECFVLGGSEFCGDATNSSIWQNSKLSGMLVTSLYLVNPLMLKDVYNPAGFRNAFVWHRTLRLVEKLIFSKALSP